MEKARLTRCAPFHGCVVLLSAVPFFYLWYAAAPPAAAPDWTWRLSIHEHARLGNIGEVERALARGTPVDVREEGSGRTPLMYAAGAGRADVVRLLLSRGAALEATSGGYGTALSAAAAADEEEGGPELVRLLLELGADPNTATTRGMTPLMNAAMNARDRSAALLIAAGARVNDRSDNGNTALMQAAATGDEALVRRLVSAGADVHARDANGHDAAAVAAESGYPRTADLLTRSAVASR